MKAFEIIAEANPFKTASRIRRAEPSLGNAGKSSPKSTGSALKAVDDPEWQDAWDWYNKNPTKTSTGVLGSDGKPIMRRLSHDEILAAYKKQKPIEQPVTTATKSSAEAEEKIAELEKKLKAAVGKTDGRAGSYISKVIGVSAGSIGMLASKIVALSGMAWPLMIYWQEVEQIKSKSWTEQEKQLALTRARGALVAMWVQQLVITAGTVGGYFLLIAWLGRTKSFKDAVVMDKVIAWAATSAGAAVLTKLGNTPEYKKAAEELIFAITDQHYGSIGETTGMSQFFTTALSVSQELAKFFGLVQTPK